MVFATGFSTFCVSFTLLNNNVEFDCLVATNTVPACSDAVLAVVELAVGFISLGAEVCTGGLFLTELEETVVVVVSAVVCTVVVGGFVAGFSQHIFSHLPHF